MCDLHVKVLTSAVLVAAMLPGSVVSADHASVLADPTRPSGWRAPETAQEANVSPLDAPLKLQGTFDVAGRRSAVINGRRVTVGDLVSGAEIVDIGRDRVLVKMNGESMELVSSVPAVKVPVAAKLTASTGIPVEIRRGPR